jgi:glycosyltransferase involved in cell wall biosynthesis
VIAHPRGSMPELISSGVNGFLVDTHEEAVEAVSSAGAIDRPGVRRSIFTRFHVDRMVDEYLALYRQLLGR